MGKKTLRPLTKPIAGDVEVPGDKSISHRAVMLGAMAKGTTKVTNFLNGEDCLHTISAFRALGVSIEQKGTDLTIESNGLSTLQEPKLPLYFGNSGTTARLMLGLLAGLPFQTVIYGDPFLTERPMTRVLTPIRKMGAMIEGRQDGRLLPLSIKGQQLSGINYTLPVKSAQVKSAILLAGLLADGETTVIEPTQTRDHTENMLKAFGVDLKLQKNEITIKGRQKLQATTIHVPGDMSSAAFLIAAAAIVPQSQLTLKNAALNKTRIGIIDELKQMNVNYSISNQQTVNQEDFGDLTIANGEMKSTVLSGKIIPRLIEEIPIIALLATQAEGTTIIKDAEELRVKETDRIHAVVDVLTSLGATIEETEDGMIVHGKTPITGCEIRSYSDHRIAMMGIIASLIANEPVTIDEIDSIDVSYPSFFEDLQRIIGDNK